VGSRSRVGPFAFFPPDFPPLVPVRKASRPERLSHEKGVSIVPPAEMRLLANRPNPFQSETTIQYSLPKSMAVRLVVYDVAGRSVRKLVDGIQEAGLRQVVWDGRDERGSPAGAGMYVYRLEAGGASLIRKTNLVK
jgi:hypothetical protein